MPTPTFTAPPAAPSTSDPSTFDARADAHLAWMATNVIEMTTGVNWMASTAAQVSTDAGTASSGAGIATTQAGIATAQANLAIAAAASAVNAPGTQGTSTSSVVMGLGAKTFTTQTGKSFPVGGSLAIASSAAPSVNRLEAVTTAYNSGTGQLDVIVIAMRGSGTIASWVISVAGTPGVKDFDQSTATTSGLNLGLYSGNFRNDNVITPVAATTVLLTANTTNYVEVYASGFATNTTGFTVGRYPLYTVVTGASTITSVTDSRGDAVGTPTPSNVIQIGQLVAMTQTTDVVTLSGYDYQRTGVLAQSGYTSAPLVSIFKDQDFALPATGNWDKIVIGNGITIVTQNSSTSAYRSVNDGQTWEAITLPANVNSSCFGNNLFAFTASTTANVYTTPDGLTWTTTTTTNVMGPIVYANSLFVAVNLSGTNAETSPTGATWTARTVPSVTNCRKLVYGNGSYVGIESAGGVTFCIQSTNGTTWNSRTLPTAHNWTDLDYGAGLFVAVTSNNTTDYATSPDGITWTSRSFASAIICSAITYNTGLFTLLLGTSLSPRSSPDGLTWTTRSLVTAPDSSNKLFALNGTCFQPLTGTAKFKSITFASGRGHHRALYADSFNRLLPFYMRMN